jgi:hypothetical protein
MQSSAAAGYGARVSDARRVAVIRLVLAVSLSMTTMEFIEIQQLPVEALRARFKLPASCDPAVTALTTDPSNNRMVVAVDCRAKPAPTTPDPPARR